MDLNWCLCGRATAQVRNFLLLNRLESHHGNYIRTACTVPSHVKSRMPLYRRLLRLLLGAFRLPTFVHPRREVPSPTQSNIPRTHRHLSGPYKWGMCHCSLIYHLLSLRPRIKLHLSKKRRLLYRLNERFIRSSRVHSDETRERSFGIKCPREGISSNRPKDTHNFFVCIYS
jgi:hypothetical protein